MEYHYYSIQTFQDPNEDFFLIDDPERIESMYELFNAIEAGGLSKDALRTYELNITCTAESDLLNSPEYRDYTDLEIELIAAQIEPLEYYWTGYRFEIVSARFLSVLNDNQIEDILHLPLILHNKFSGRSWTNYFALRFTAYLKRNKVIAQKLFVDDKSLVTYYSEDLKGKIEALSLQNQQFLEMLPSKFI